MVISEQVADQYFESNPIGSTISVDNQWDLEVTGVFREIGSSHFQPRLIGSFTTSDRAADDNWMNNTLATYVRLAPGTNVAAVDEGLAAIVRKYSAPLLEGALGVSFDEAIVSGLKYDYVLEPMGDLYLESEALWSLGRTGNIMYVYVLSIIALFVLVIACINFINLSTARATGRAREVGLRKVLGSNRPQLIKQFLGESTVVVFISTVSALALAAVVLPWFNQVAGTELAVGPWMLVTLALVAIVTGILAGFYPALVLSRFRPAVVLRGTFSRSSKGAALRSTLVVFQFSISIALIIGTGVVYKQLHYMHNQDLGFYQDQIVVLPVETQEFEDSFDSFRQEVVGQPGIVDAAISDMVPGPDHTHNETAFRATSASSDQAFLASAGEVSPGFVETLGLTMVAGRSFSREMETDREAWVINETAARRMGWSPEEAIGQSLSKVGGRRWEN